MIVLGDSVQMVGQVDAEITPVRITEEGPERVQLGRVLRQDLGLLVVHHLQTMLDLAQEPVAQAHLVGDLLPDPAGRDQGL